MIHSPSSNEGTPWKQEHVHGGATKKAPPDKIIFQINDSTFILVGARTIYEKKNFGGILFPIFPLFWLPKVNFYKEEPNSLIIELSTLGNEIELQVNSASITSSGQTYQYKEVLKLASSTEIKFPLSAEQTTEFELTKLSLFVNGKFKNLPKIRFKKMKQRWRFIGP